MIDPASAERLIRYYGLAGAQARLVRLAAGMASATQERVERVAAGMAHMSDASAAAMLDVYEQALAHEQKGGA